MTVFVTGKTWEYRDHLNSQGGRWNGNLKRWEFSSISDRFRAQLRTYPGITVNEVEEIIKRVLDSLDDNASTNIFGDDQTWLNYFADQHPISFHGFSSLSAMTKYVAKLDPSDWSGNRDRGWQSDREWFGTSDMNEALNLARNGWPDGYAMAQEIVRLLTAKHAQQRRRKHSVAGGFVNVGRLLSNNPMHMIMRRKTNAQKIITFFVHTGSSASISADDMIIRAALTAAMVDILETNQYSCDIVGVHTVRHKGKAGAQTITTLKAAGEPLNLNDIVFALGHPSFLRRMIFACNGSDPDLSGMWDSMGMPSSAFTTDHPTGSNEFYIGRIPHNSAIYGDTLIEQAMCIWDLIIDKQLPITLNRGNSDNG